MTIIASLLAKKGKWEGMIGLRMRSMARLKWAVVWVGVSLWYKITKTTANTKGWWVTIWRMVMGSWPIRMACTLRVILKTMASMGKGCCTMESIGQHILETGSTTNFMEKEFFTTNSQLPSINPSTIPISTTYKISGSNSKVFLFRWRLISRRH